MREQSGCYLESTVRTDVKAYDSLSLRIKKFKRNSFDPECTVIVLRVWNDNVERFTLHAGINIFAKLTEYSPKEIGTNNKEIVAMAEQVIATRDYKLIGPLLDRMQELDLIPSNPYWYRQWIELVNTFCLKPTVYHERLCMGRYGNPMVLLDVAVTNIDATFYETWAELETEGFVGEEDGEEFKAVLARWIAANRPTDNVQRFILRNYF